MNLAMGELTLEQRQHFRDELRTARSSALADLEGLQRVVLALESLGAYLFARDGKPLYRGNLGKYRDYLEPIAGRSRLAHQDSTSALRLHLSFDELFERVKAARNDAMHQGAYARLAVTHAVHLCLLIEDGLMADSNRIGDYTVKEPVCATLWQPLSYVRQLLLSNSYSSLPVLHQGEWKLVRDLELALFLRRRGRDVLAMSLEDAVSNCGLELLSPCICAPQEAVASALDKSGGLPVLVVDSEKRLLGLATPFDLL